MHDYTSGNDMTTGFFRVVCINHYEKAARYVHLSSGMPGIVAYSQTHEVHCIDDDVDELEVEPQDTEEDCRYAIRIPLWLAKSLGWQEDD